MFPCCGWLWFWYAIPQWLIVQYGAMVASSILGRALCQFIELLSMISGIHCLHRCLNAAILALTFRTHERPGPTRVCLFLGYHIKCPLHTIEVAFQSKGVRGGPFLGFIRSSCDCVRLLVTFFVHFPTQLQHQISSASPYGGSVVVHLVTVWLHLRLSNR